PVHSPAGPRGRAPAGRRGESAVSRHATGRGQTPTAPLGAETRGVTLATPRAGSTGLGSYWEASRAPRYSLLFALPLLVLYQILATLQPVGRQGSLRNGADVILESLFVALAGRQGPLLFMLCLIAGGLWLVARDMRSRGGWTRLRGSVFALMLAES